MDRKIALEEHFSTEDNNKYWDAHGEENRNGRDYAKDIERRLLDPEACVREMDWAGIELCILSLTSPGVQSVVDPIKAARLARSANDYAAYLIQKCPDRLRAFAAVPMQDPKAAVEELQRAVVELEDFRALSSTATPISDRTRRCSTWMKSLYSLSGTVPPSSMFRYIFIRGSHCRARLALYGATLNSSDPLGLLPMRLRATQSV